MMYKALWVLQKSRKVGFKYQSIHIKHTHELVFLIVTENNNQIKLICAADD